MKLNLPSYVLDIIRELENKHEAFVVGGAVRDLLMRRVVDDWDVTTNATPEEIQAIFPDSFYGNSYGTVMLPISELESPVDITTYRTEGTYSDSRRPDTVSWGKTIFEDLQRRDFTINAMALKIVDKSHADSMHNVEIIDPYDGQIDLEKKIVKCVGVADVRFAEDALRMMRAVRIASELEFQIDEDTLNSIKKNAHLLKKISGERIRDELFKILMGAKPDQGILKLRDSGILVVILPELAECFGVDQKSPQRHHIDDVGTHLIKSLSEVRSTNVITRLATLIHDIGKPKVKRITTENVITFYNHEVVGARIAGSIAERLKLSSIQKDKLYKLVRYHQFSVTEKQSDSAIKRFIRNIGVDLIEEMLELRRADRIGSGAAETSWRTEEFKKRLVEVQKQPFSVKDLKIGGSEVMKELSILPSPKVGQILNRLFEKVESGSLKNSKIELLKEVRRKK